MKIAISRTDGGVSIMTIVGDADPLESIEKWKESHVGEYVSHREVTANDLPADRSTRDAWVDNGGKIEVDESRLPQ